MASGVKPVPVAVSVALRLPIAGFFKMFPTCRPVVRTVALYVALAGLVKLLKRPFRAIKPADEVRFRLALRFSALPFTIPVMSKLSGRLSWALDNAEPANRAMSDFVV